MGDDIGSGSVTGCRLMSLGDHRQQTEQKTKTNGTQTGVITLRKRLQNFRKICEFFFAISACFCNVVLLHFKGFKRH